MHDVWLPGAEKIPSPHFDNRECSAKDIDLLVIHNISLPPAQCEKDFNNELVEAFFQGHLDCEQHPYFKSIKGLRVSAHLYIKRNGHLVQFVPLNERAWHAGKSVYQGKEKCNDFSIGIELQGTDDMPFTEAQYQTLANVTKQIKILFPKIKDNIVGHSDIAPGRKTDPGKYFDWNHYFSKL